MCQVQSDAFAIHKFRYPTPMIIMHWLTATLCVLVLALAFIRMGVEARSIRLFLLNAHRSLGMTLWLLTLGRVGLRLKHQVAAPLVSKSWQRWMVSSLHGVLYLLLLVQPLVGWAVTNAHGHTVVLFGQWSFPHLLEADPDLADNLGTIHEVGAWILIALILGHASAALMHHYVLRDSTLKRMMPTRRP